MKKVSPQDLQMIQKILDLADEIEQSSRDHEISEEQLFKIQFILKYFETCEDPSLKKIALITEHLHPQMTLQHFANFMVPLERLIDRSTRDDDFLVTEHDLPYKDIHRRDIYFVLDHIRSAFNVGSIFRLADSVGVKNIYLCGYTPTPEQSALKKTAMGTDQIINYESFSHTEDVLKTLRQQGIFLIALETSKKSKDLFSSSIKGPTAFVVGNERFGLDRKILELCDEVRSIPMFGIKNSLNVANSLSVAAYEWSRQNP